MRWVACNNTSSAAFSNTNRSGILPVCLSAHAAPRDSLSHFVCLPASLSLCLSVSVSLSLSLSLSLATVLYTHRQPGICRQEHRVHSQLLLLVLLLLPVPSPSDPVLQPVPSPSDPVACLIPIRSCCLSHLHQILLRLIPIISYYLSHPHQILLPVSSPSDVACLISIKSCCLSCLHLISIRSCCLSRLHQILLPVSSPSDPVACPISISPTACLSSMRFNSSSLSHHLFSLADKRWGLLVSGL